MIAPAAMRAVGTALAVRRGKGSCAEPGQVALRAFSLPSPSLMLLLLVVPEFALPLVRRPMTRIRSAALHTWLTTSRLVASDAVPRREPRFRELEPRGQLVAATGGHSSGSLTTDDGQTDIP